MDANLKVQKMNTEPTLILSHIVWLWTLTYEKVGSCKAGPIQLQKLPSRAAISATPTSCGLYVLVTVFGMRGMTHDMTLAVRNAPAILQNTQGQKVV